MVTESRWICCQIGARQHYIVPRVLHRAQRLSALITDLWVSPESRVRTIGPRRLAERFHPELADGPVIGLNRACVAFEGWNSLRRRDGWSVMIRRNEWFQRRALAELTRVARCSAKNGVRLFSFSYAARHLLAFAKSEGWVTMLEQIDPGPLEEEIVADIHRQHSDLAGSWQPAPPEYWRYLEEEWSLADRIIVNSHWSLKALIRRGVPEKKIWLIPLSYDAPSEATRFQRTYPTAFTSERRLRVLFLGLVNLRKGLAATLAAMRLLEREPVEFWFVGPIQMCVPAQWRNAPNAKWIGGVPRSDAETYYRNADVFLFPTLSDGFGLTQLEAQAWKLPVIASQFCGEVVQDGINGLVLGEVSGRTIADAIRSLIAQPERLSTMSGNSVAGQFGSSNLMVRLEHAADVSRSSRDCTGREHLRGQPAYHPQACCT
jgi:glycosyltransferase involved in cell wall biosynthesis